MASGLGSASPQPPPRVGKHLDRRPRGRLRHYAGLLSASGAAGLPLALERNRQQRGQRLLKTLTDGARERRSPTRRRMRALQAAPGGHLRFKEVPTPALPGPEGAIVHPIAASTCDLDCPIALGSTQFALPLHLGHECVAEAITVGERVKSVKPGDRVVVPFQINCGICQACLAGRTGNCTSVPPVSMYGMGVLAGHWGGAFSDELAVPYADAMLVALPKGIDRVAAASVADNICDAHRHIAPHLPKLLEEDPDAEVLILAAMTPRLPFSSSVPLYTGLIARAHGARNVCIVDARAPVRAHAERLGLEALHPQKIRRRPPARLVVDVTVDRLGVAVASTAPDGICTSSGSFHRSARIPTLAMYARNVTVHMGRAHVRALIPEVLGLMQEGRLHPEAVITSVASLDDAPGALLEHFRRGGVKTVLTA
jgi:alcohol dehydrogenase